MFGPFLQVFWIWSQSVLDMVESSSGVFSLVHIQESQEAGMDISKKQSTLGQIGCASQCFNQVKCQGFIYYDNESSCSTVLIHSLKDEDFVPITTNSTDSTIKKLFLKINRLQTVPILFVALGHNRNTNLHVYSPTGACYGHEMNFPVHDPTKVAFHRQCLGYHKGIMLFCGGFHELASNGNAADLAQDSCYFIDLEHKPLTWNSSVKLPQKRTFGWFLGVGDKMYLVGGMNYADQPDNSMLAFDVNTQTMSPIPTSSDGSWVQDSFTNDIVYFCALVVEDRYIVFIGGLRFGQAQDRVLEFDTVSRTWKVLNPLTKPRRSVLCGLVTLDSKSYIMAASSDPQGLETTVELLPAQQRHQSWSIAPEFTTDSFNLDDVPNQQVIQNRPNGEFWMMDSKFDLVITVHPNGTWSSKQAKIGDVTFVTPIPVPTKYFMEGPCIPFE